MKNYKRPGITEGISGSAHGGNMKARKDKAPGKTSQSNRRAQATDSQISAAPKVTKPVGYPPNKLL